jgi:hypothetical protein
MRTGGVGGRGRRRTQVVKKLQCAHEGLGRRRVHEVEVDKVIDAKALQRKHNVGQVGPQDLGVSLPSQQHRTTTTATAIHSHIHTRNKINNCNIDGHHNRHQASKQVN